MKWLGIYISGGSYGRCHRLVTSGGRKEGFWIEALEAELGCAGVFFQIFLWGVAIIAVISLFRWLFA